MAIAARIKWFMDSRGVSYDLVHHPHTSTSLGSAAAARLPRERVVKSVVLEDERGYLVAVLPASRRISLHDLQEQLGRGLELATESELATLFADCDLGAIPPFGTAYGLPTLVDDSLMNLPEVWFEAGDHADLVHVRGLAFLSLLTGARHGRFSRPA
jgi:Ala-tRNA(Pro) deacylase